MAGCLAAISAAAKRVRPTSSSTLSPSACDQRNAGLLFQLAHQARRGQGAHQLDVFVMHLGGAPIFRHIEVDGARADADRPGQAGDLAALACTASHKVRTLMSCAYQYQPLMFFCSGSKVGLFGNAVFCRPYAGDQGGVVGIGDGGQGILHAAGIDAARPSARAARELSGRAPAHRSRRRDASRRWRSSARARPAPPRAP